MITIRPMNSSDVEPVYAYGINEHRFRVNETSSGFWTQNQLHRWMASQNDVLLVAEDQGKIVGFALSQTHLATGKTTIENLYVSDNYRGQGLGKKLLRECVDQCRRKGSKYICCLVEPDNEAIIRASESVGFKPGSQFIWMDKNET